MSAKIAWETEYVKKNRMLNGRFMFQKIVFSSVCEVFLLQVLTVKWFIGLIKQYKPMH